MAVVTGNSLMQKLSGTLGGDVVFKRYGDKTVVCMKAAGRRKNSPLQELYSNKFKDAARHARMVLRDPVKRDHYTKLAKKLKKHCAYNVLISEYMLSIRIAAKDTPAAVSKDKTRVTLTATKKDFKVKEVSVNIVRPDGEPVASVKANRISTTDWVLKLPHAPEKGSVLVVTATDALGLTTIRHITV